jgi:site-specific DNA recombinase
MENKKVGVWIRVSTEDQARGDSPLHHLERAKMYASVKGWEIVSEYHLEGVSGKAVLHHPEAKRMLRDIASGKITGLVFSKLARLARNTRELIVISEYFQKYSADLVSLDETIDTSTPAGRFFYSLLSAMSQWEREEIAGRVKATIPIRAKLGKSLGGNAPFGYRWENNQLVLDEKEAPVRKLMFELFKKYERKSTVANMLHDMGYRTRNGSKFTLMTMTRILTDPISKGLRRANYKTGSANGRSWELKPESEWVFTPAPAIVSEELWDEVNLIITRQQSAVNKPLKMAKRLFTGVIFCHCGGKMLGESKGEKYVCKSCKNKICLEVIDEIFHEQIRDFVFSEEEVDKYFSGATLTIEEKKNTLKSLQKELEEMEAKMTRLVDLNISGELPEKGFKNHYAKLNQRSEELLVSISRVEGEILAESSLLSEKSHIVSESRDLYSRWPSLTFDEQRYIVTSITKSLKIGVDTVDVEFHKLPSLSPDPNLLETVIFDIRIAAGA